MGHWCTASVEVPCEQVPNACSQPNSNHLLICQLTSRGYHLSATVPIILLAGFLQPHTRCLQRKGMQEMPRRLRHTHRGSNLAQSMRLQAPVLQRERHRRRCSLPNLPRRHRVRWQCDIARPTNPPRLLPAVQPVHRCAPLSRCCRKLWRPQRVCAELLGLCGQQRDSRSFQPLP